eukprot:610066-Pleurochrysis_carterae.AAC.3
MLSALTLCFSDCSASSSCRSSRLSVVWMASISLRLGGHIREHAPQFHKISIAALPYVGYKL